MKIKAVLYDLGDIFFEAHFWREWNFQALSKLGCFKGNFNDFYNLYEFFLADVYKGIKNYDQVFTEFLKHIGVLNVKKFKNVSYNKKKEFETNRVLYSQVEETLSIIQECDIKNIIISDNEMDKIGIREKILNRFNLNRYISFVFTSFDLGMDKSDPKTFNFVLNKIGLYPEEVIFVGHDKDELISANMSKIRTIEFNNYLNVRTGASYKIECFDELVNYLEK